MKHYSNHYSSSRTYYEDLQRNNYKDLNSSKKKLDTLEFHLEKFLMITYKHLSPIFEDDEVMTSFKTETTNNYIDKSIDEHISTYTPSWVQRIAAFFTHLCQKHFSPRPKNKLSKTIKYFMDILNEKSETKHKQKSSFILNKSSP
jgi:hypothetical protein